MGLLALFSLVTGAWWAAGCERKLLRTAPLERPPPPSDQGERVWCLALSQLPVRPLQL